MREKEWGWRGVMGYISPAVVLSYGSEVDYKLGLLGFGTMQITLGLVNATDDNLGKVLPVWTVRQKHWPTRARSSFASEVRRPLWLTDKT